MTPAELAALRRILVVKLSSLGDILHVTPCLRALRRACPAARIAMAVDRRFGALVRESPHLDEVIEADAGRGARRAPGSSPGATSRDAAGPVRSRDRLPGNAPERPLGLRERGEGPGGHGSRPGERRVAPGLAATSCGRIQHVTPCGSAPTSPRRSASPVEDLDPELHVSGEADRRCAARLARGRPPSAEFRPRQSLHPLGVEELARGAVPRAGRPVSRATRACRSWCMRVRARKRASRRSARRRGPAPVRRRGRTPARGVARALPPSAADGDGRYRAHALRRRARSSRRRPVRPDLAGALRALGPRASGRPALAPPDPRHVPDRRRGPAHPSDRRGDGSPGGAGRPHRRCGRGSRDPPTSSGPRRASGRLTPARRAPRRVRSSPRGSG